VIWVAATYILSGSEYDCGRLERDDTRVNSDLNACSPPSFQLGAIFLRYMKSVTKLLDTAHSMSRGLKPTEIGLWLSHWHEWRNEDRKPVRKIRADKKQSPFIPASSAEVICLVLQRVAGPVMHDNIIGSDRYRNAVRPGSE
jgi:hypothetical protein